jgi:hypothetical protein
LNSAARVQSGPALACGRCGPAPGLAWGRAWDERQPSACPGRRHGVTARLAGWQGMGDPSYPKQPASLDIWGTVGEVVPPTGLSGTVFRLDKAGQSRRKLAICLERKANAPGHWPWTRMSRLGATLKAARPFRYSNVVSGYRCDTLPHDFPPFLPIWPQTITLRRAQHHGTRDALNRHTTKEAKP